MRSNSYLFQLDMRTTFVLLLTFISATPLLRSKRHYYAEYRPIVPRDTYGYGRPGFQSYGSSYGYNRPLGGYGEPNTHTGFQGGAWGGGSSWGTSQQWGNQGSLINGRFVESGPGFHQPRVDSDGFTHTQHGATEDLGVNDGPYSTAGQTAPRPPQVSGDVSPPVASSSPDEVIEKSASNGAVPNIPDGMSMEMRG